MSTSVTELVSHMTSSAHLIDALNARPVAYFFASDVKGKSHGQLEECLRRALAEIILHNRQAAAIRQLYSSSVCLKRIGKGDDRVGGAEADLPWEERAGAVHSPERDIIWRVMVSVLMFPRPFIVQHGLSKMMVYICACLALQLKPVNDDVRRLIDNALQWLQMTDHINLQSEIDRCRNAELLDPETMDMTNGTRGPWHHPRTSAELRLSPSGDVFEICDICGEGIGWLDIHTAQCANNHLFGKRLFNDILRLESRSGWANRVCPVRCSLTFLAIQGPGQSKYCGLCGKVYLLDAKLLNYKTKLIDDATTAYQAGSPASAVTEQALTSIADVGHLGNQRVGGSDSGARSVSIAQLLLAACDLCIYCGGKFVS